MIGVFPRIYCDLCGKDTHFGDLVKIEVRSKVDGWRIALPYDFHRDCGVGARNMLLEYGGVNLTQEHSHYLLPGPGAWE
jgi:hypothetical protein